VLRDLGLALTVEEAHEMFLGKTVAGVLDAIAARTGMAPPAGFTYNWAFATAHAFMRELRPVPYVRAALEELVRRGHSLSVASQSPLARVRMSLEVAGLAEFFGERIFVTSMVARPKPAPDVYLLAAQRMQLAPKICDALSARPTWNSSVPSWALNDRELGQTDPCASCRRMPSRSACSRIRRIAASSSRIAGGSETIAQVSLIDER